MDLLPRISPYSVRIQENAYQNNSEYGHLLRGAKVNAFTLLKDLFNSKSKLFFERSANHDKRT